MKNLMKLCGRVVVASLLALVLGTGATHAQLNAYVANASSNSISVIDTATNTVTATLPLEGSPRGIAIDSVRSLAYVATASQDTVTVLDLLTNAVVAVVPIGFSNDIVLSANRDFVYVSVAGNSTVAVIDTATNTVVAEIPIGDFSGVLALALAPDGSVYAADDFGVVSVIDTATNTITSTFATGATWTDIAFTPDGAFAYLSGYETGTLVLDMATRTVIATIPTGNLQFGIAMTPNGAFVYQPGYFSEEIFVIDTAANSVVATIPVAGGAGIAMTPDGAFAYVATIADNVQVIDIATNTVVATVPVGTTPFRITIGRPVLTLRDQIAALGAQINALVEGGALAPNQAFPLTNKLQQIVNRFDGGQTTAACNQLGAFINQVNADIGSGTLTAAQGQALIDAAEAIQATLGC